MQGQHRASPTGPTPTATSRLTPPTTTTPQPDFWALSRQLLATVEAELARERARDSPDAGEVARLAARKAALEDRMLTEASDAERAVRAAPFGKSNFTRAEQEELRAKFREHASPEQAEQVRRGNQEISYSRCRSWRRL